MKNNLINKTKELKEAEEKAKREGNNAPFAFVSEVSGKIYVF